MRHPLLVVLTAMLLACSAEAGPAEDGIAPGKTPEAEEDGDAKPGKPPGEIATPPSLPCAEIEESFDAAIDPAKFAVNGTASLVAAPKGGSHVRLTAATPGQAGSIVFRQPVGEHFTVSFSVFITAPAGGGDGMALQLLSGNDPAALGKPGGSLGLAPLAGYGVTFDTSKNTESGDTDANHLALVNASDLKPVATTIGIPLLDSATFFAASVAFDAGAVVVSLNGVEVLKGTLPGYTAQPLLVGFSGATGGASNVHVIDNLKIQCRTTADAQPPKATTPGRFGPVAQAPTAAMPVEPLLPALPPNQVDVTAIRVTSTDGKAPVKGDPLRVTLTVKNLSATPGSIPLSPLVTSARFTDFKDVPLGTVTANLAANETKDVSFDAGPFIESAGGANRYALGRSAYTVPSVRIGAGAGARSDTALTGGSFTIGASKVMFNAVLYDATYLTKLKYLGDVQTYMLETFTRHAEVFTPKSAGSDEGTYRSFVNGFDEMMGMRQIFRTIPGLDLVDSGDAVKNCTQVGAFAQRTLGLAKNWMDDKSPGTDVDHHGFDIAVGLVPESLGGIACTGEGLQYTGVFDSDLSIGRSQMLVAHETSHLAGSPHCDPLQGTMMCSGEKHPHFKEAGSFVWHKISRDTMTDRWD